MPKTVISGTGLFTPPQVITNTELTNSYNKYVQGFNREHSDAIRSGEKKALMESSPEFIMKASGIESRHVLNKEGILDSEIMCPQFPPRSNDKPSLQCEMAISAAQEALEFTKKDSGNIDAVLVACSNMERPYPAIAIEIQSALNIRGFAFDLNVACASASFAIQVADGMIKNGNASCILIVNPEICTGHLNFRDRDSHFIFGDACTAMIIEKAETCRTQVGFEILSTKLLTEFSNNIRNNFGFLNRTTPSTPDHSDKLFVQQGRKVFKEVVPTATSLIKQHLDEFGISASDLKRLWLHQANLNMNQLIAKKILGRDATPTEAPVILNEYGNTSSAGAVIAFHMHREDLEIGDLGILCAFGAGYSVGSVLLRKVIPSKII